MFEDIQQRVAHENADLMCMPLSMFHELSPMTINALGVGHPEGKDPYLYLGDLVQADESEIKGCRNLGVACLGEIQNLFNRLGLQFNTELSHEVREALESLPRERPKRVSGRDLHNIRADENNLALLNQHLEGLGALTYPPPESYQKRQPVVKDEAAPQVNNDSHPGVGVASKGLFQSLIDKILGRS